MRLVQYPWFPYIFALGFPLTVYSHNMAAFGSSDLLRPVVLFMLVAVLLVVIFRHVLVSRVLADTAAAIPLIGIWLLGLGWQLYLMLALLAFVCFMFRHYKFSEKSLPVINALAVGVLFLPMISIYQVASITYHGYLQKIPYSPFSAPRSTQMRGEKPDIYHIVLDAYGGSEALAGELGFDNSKFFHDLRSLDFIVNESIIAPYNETIHVMSAIFLGEYLREGEFPIDSDSSSTLRSTLGALIVNGPVHDILRKNGYSILYADPGHQFLRFPRSSTILRSQDYSLLNGLEMHLGKLSGLNRLLPSLYEVTQEHPLIIAVKDAFKNDYSDFKSPKFVYQHILAPHTPFIIDRTGAMTSDFPGFSGTAEGDSVVQGSPVRRQLYVSGYLEKLRFVNDRAIGQLQRLRKLPGKKIIVIHGDHGSGSKYYLNDPDRTCLRERFTTFLAVYTNDLSVRDEFRWITKPGATMVNLYRSMFNALLDLDLEMLSSKSAFVKYSAPHQLIPLDSSKIPLPCGELN